MAYHRGRSRGRCPQRRAGADSRRLEELQTFSGVLNHIRQNYPDTVSYWSW